MKDSQKQLNPSKGSSSKRKRCFLKKEVKKKKRENYAAKEETYEAKEESNESKEENYEDDLFEERPFYRLSGLDEVIIDDFI